jgi:hypothetical protein
MTRKFIYYLKNFSRPIVITDQEDTPLDQLKKDISDIMSGNNIATFETNDDVLIARPLDIAAVHIAKNSEDNMSNFENIDEYHKKETEINLQSIVPEIDLGDIDSDIDPTEISEEEIQDISDNDLNQQEEDEIVDGSD